MGKVSSFEKLAFWALVGIISVFFAEVISGSTPYPYFTAPGWLIVFPVYALHTVVLGTIVLKYGKPTLYALYPAGMIFGMYETYITKVVWGGAEWGSNGPSVFGIYLIPFFLVVLFWHPFMSFIIPLTLSEASLTRSRGMLSYLPERITSLFSTPEKAKKSLIYGTVLFGLMGMFNLDVLSCLLSSLSSAFFVLIGVLLWRRYMLRRGRTLGDYLPGKVGFSIALVLLLLFYLFSTFSFKPEYLPPAPVHLFTFLIYALLFLLLWKNLKVSRRERPRRFKFPFAVSTKFIVILIFIFAATTTIEALIPLRLLIFAFFLVVETIIGFVFVYYSIRHAVGSRGILRRSTGQHF